MPFVYEKACTWLDLSTSKVKFRCNIFKRQKYLIAFNDEEMAVIDGYHI